MQSGKITGDSQEQLGRLLGVSGVTIWSYKTGEKLPRMARAIEIARALGVSAEWLLTGQSSKEIEFSPIHANEFGSIEAIFGNSLNRLSSLHPAGISNGTQRFIQKLTMMEMEGSLPQGLVAAMEKTVDEFAKAQRPHVSAAHLEGLYRDPDEDDKNL
jgi:transcriptional regulator with XRE-family HTH domain